MRILLFITMFVFSILMFGGEALACDCLPPTPEESFRRAGVVFEGEVVRVNGKSPASTSYTFRVSKVLKGPSVREVVIFRTGSNCDETFFPRIVYRVYAREYEGKLRSSMCSGNYQKSWKRSKILKNQP